MKILGRNGKPKKRKPRPKTETPKEIMQLLVPLHLCFLKTTTNSSCVCTHLANKADSDSDSDLWLWLCTNFTKIKALQLHKLILKFQRINQLQIVQIFI